ncbi:three-Cys-motif partner protein TcmP [Streptomyces sp. NPDC088354]|uniref:three-Cys-motif partner protein TcmP n=1 Tax=Streptomyces sp. NPDC088354 TaxID=3365856 RepID=UPI0037FF0511
MFKHELLRHYIPPFGGMTGSQSQNRRVVYLDGYAGEGRYENGEPGSAEIALQVAAHHRSRNLDLSCFFVEQAPKSFQRLESVVNSYQAQGVSAKAHRGEVDDVLDDVVRQAQGLPLFLFLDPCGLCLPMERLVEVLAQRRPKGWPATELLMNFSMMAVWRLGGHVKSPKGNEKSLERFDAVCGGRWWREYFSDPTVDKDHATEAVAAEYARRLAKQTGMFVQSVPVTKAPHRKPVYHLVFATRSPYGLWVFGDALARARDAWWKTLELQDGEDNPDTLFSSVEVLRPNPAELEKAAVPVMAANLDAVLQQARRPVKLVDYTLELFGTYYGQVTDPAARKAVKHLHKEGRTPTTGVGEKKIRELVVHPAAPA